MRRFSVLVLFAAAVAAVLWQGRPDVEVAAPLHADMPESGRAIGPVEVAAVAPPRMLSPEPVARDESHSTGTDQADEEAVPKGTIVVELRDEAGQPVDALARLVRLADGEPGAEGARVRIGETPSGTKRTEATDGIARFGQLTPPSLPGLGRRTRMVRGSERADRARARCRRVRPDHDPSDSSGTADHGPRLGSGRPPPSGSDATARLEGSSRPQRRLRA